MSRPTTSMLRRSAVAMLGALMSVAVLGACATRQSGQGASAPASAPARVAPTASAARARPSVPAPPVLAAVDQCAGNTSSQLIKVSLREQRMWLCQRSVTVLSTAITSGASAVPDDSTPTGNFRIQGRNTDSVLTLNTGAQYRVKYWIPFSAPLYGFHDASWQSFPYGSPLYRTQGSHGCVHMPLTAIAFLYRWVHVGTEVRIRA